MQDTPHDEDETISLRDLTLYSDQSVECDAFNQSHASSSYFEFFNQELDTSVTTTAINFPHENIIFCGKLIPYKQQTTDKHDSSHPVKPKSQANAYKSSMSDQFKNLSRWKFSCSIKNGTKSTTLMHTKEKYNTNGKMSILTSSSSGKGKWYLFMFGISRFSTEVKLGDIKGRRSRRRCSSPPHPPPSPTAAAMFGFQNWDEAVNEGRNRGWWLSGLIRALSCGGNHHQSTTMATAAIGCAPPE